MEIYWFCIEKYVICEKHIFHTKLGISVLFGNYLPLPSPIPTLSAVPSAVLSQITTSTNKLQHIIFQYCFNLSQKENYIYRIVIKYSILE